MTPQEAIKRIEEFGLHHAIRDLPHSTYTVEAFEMAINALEQQDKTRWIPVTERLPDLDEDGYSEKLLLSFDNFSLPAIGEYRQDPDDSGAWYEGDCDETLLSYGLIVNAWMPLPEQYKEEL